MAPELRPGCTAEPASIQLVSVGFQQEKWKSALLGLPKVLTDLWIMGDHFQSTNDAASNFKPRTIFQQYKSEKKMFKGQEELYVNSQFGKSFYFLLPLAVQGNDVALIEENEIFMTTITRKTGFK